MLPKGTPFKVPLKAYWQPPPKKKHSKANQQSKTSAEITKCAADVAIQKLQKERQEEAQKQKDIEVDEDIEEDEQQPFDEPSVLYDEVLGGLEDEVVILEAGEDDDSWLDNAEVL